MKLLLTSTGLSNPNLSKRFLELLKIRPEIAHVLFIPTASFGSDCGPVERGYVEESKKELIQLGINHKNIIDFDADSPPNPKNLKSINVVYICGGNTFYLLSKIRETKFDRIIPDLIKGGAVYVGVSAGSILAGPNIDIAEPFDANDIGIKDLTALNLTNIIVSPHYTEKDKNIVEKYKRKEKFSVIPLTDLQALSIEGNISEIIE